MREIGEEKLQAVLGVAQLKKLKDLSRAGIDATYQPPYAAVNSSNTAVPVIGPLLLPDAIEKIAARSGYGSQLQGALAARPTRNLPELPPELARALLAFPGVLTPAVVSPLNQSRQAANE
jgi:hypothetical protein